MSRSSCASKPPATLSTGIGPEWSISSPGRPVVEVVFGSISNKKKATNWRYAEVIHVPESECYACHVLNPVGSMMSKKPCVARAVCNFGHRAFGERP